MRCSRVKGLLSDYLDGTLDADRADLVEKHLARCEKCRKELESLRALIQELRALEPLETPAGFLTDLHARLAKDTWLGRLRSFLSFPARIRLPLEFATLAATLVIAFFVFHLVPFSQAPKSTVSRQQEKLDFSTTSPDAVSKPVSKSDSLQSTASEKVPAPVVAAVSPEQTVSATQADEKEKSLRKDDYAFTTVPVPADMLRKSRSAPEAKEPAPAAPGAAIETGSVSGDLKKSEQTTAFGGPIALLESKKIKDETTATTSLEGNLSAVETPSILMVLHIASSRDKSNPSSTDERETTAHADAVPKQEDQPPPAATGSRAQVKTEKEVSKNKAAPIDGGYLRPALFPPGTDRAAGETNLRIEKIVSALEGKISAVERNRETGQPEILNLEIPARHFETLTAKLRELGTLEVPVPADMGTGPQKILIRLYLRRQP